MAGFSVLFYDENDKLLEAVVVEAETRETAIARATQKAIEEFKVNWDFAKLNRIVVRSHKRVAKPRE